MISFFPGMKLAEDQKLKDKAVKSESKFLYFCSIAAHTSLLASDSNNGGRRHRTVYYSGTQGFINTFSHSLNLGSSI